MEIPSGWRFPSHVHDGNVATGEVERESLEAYVDDGHVLGKEPGDAISSVERQRRLAPHSMSRRFTLL